MNRYYSGDKEAAEVVNKVLTLRLQFGSPYITFTGNANRSAPAFYQDKGMEIKHSQLCLLPYEKVLIQSGCTLEGKKTLSEVPIVELAEWNAKGIPVTIFDGRNWVETLSFKARGTEKMFIKVLLQDHSIFYTTFNHIHALEDGTRVKAQDLKAGMFLWGHNQGGRAKGIKVLSVDIVGYPFIKDVNGNQMFTEPPMTYCPTIPSTNLFGLANGVLTGNCNEIYQYSDTKHSYICVLSSLNLSKFDEWYEKYYHGFSVVEWGIFFLDAVVDELINRMSKSWGKYIPKRLLNNEWLAELYTLLFAKPGVSRALRSTIKGRALGLGTLGWHAYLMGKGIPFDSNQASILNKEVHQYVGRNSLRASARLANFRGESAWTKGYHIRNSQLNAIAPTTTNSILCGGITAGIEPIPGNMYEKIGAKVNKVRKNPYLESLLEKKGQNTPAVWNEILENKGSVSSLSFLSDEEKEVFKTFREIDPEVIIRQAADRQPYIFWQGQSLNLYYSYDTPAEKIVKDFLLAYSLGLKGLYYVRSNNKMQETNKKAPVQLRTRTDCIWCQRAKELLNSYGIPYQEEYKPNGRVPEIEYFGEYLVGGYEELERRLNSGVTNTSGCAGCEG